jgi:hypothetical protein
VNGGGLVWFRVRWPREVGFDRLQAVSLLVSSTHGPAVVEAVGSGGSVEHRLAVGRAHAELLVEQLRAVLPGVGLTPLEQRPVLGATLSVEVRLSSPHRPLRLGQAELVSRALITALAQARAGEAAVVQWQLWRMFAAASIGKAEHFEAAPRDLLQTLVGHHHRPDAESLSALRSKRAMPTWRCVGRIGVRAENSARARHLLHQLVRALGVADAPSVRLTARRANPSRLDLIARPWLAPLRLNTDELALLAGWPVGAASDLPVERSPNALPPSSAIPRSGRLLGRATFPGRERPLCLSPTDSLGHLHALGPTGSGKSTLLVNLIAQDLEAGRGLVVIEPKGDLIASVLERVPASRIDDVVVLDPTDGECPVGLNPLASNGRSPELVADELLGMFRAMYDSWGPRTNDILAAALLTLTRVPGLTLCALPSLLADSAFRHRIVSRMHDPVGLEPFWAGFEAWSEAERTAAIAPSLSRVRPFLIRPQLRRVLGQSAPRFDLNRVFTERKVLLVNLAKGPLGRETTGLLGGFVLSQLWAAALRRAALPPEKRHPVFVYVDEVQDYLRLATDLGDALVQARALGVGFVVAHQHMSQLDPLTRAAVLTNARSRVCFQLAGDDARMLASGPVSADDLRELAPFEAYAQLFAGGAVRPWCSLRTLPPPPPMSNPQDVRSRSREHFGVAAQEVDAAVEQLIAGGRSSADDIAPRRRVNRGAR